MPRPETTDSRKLAQEARGIAGWIKAFEMTDDERRQLPVKILTLADALDAALDERDAAKDRAQAWNERWQTAFNEVARLQAENERLNKALTRARTCLSVHDLAQVDEIVRAALAKQG